MATWAFKSVKPCPLTDYIAYGSFSKANAEEFVLGHNTWIQLVDASDSKGPHTLVSQPVFASLKDLKALPRLNSGSQRNGIGAQDYLVLLTSNNTLSILEFSEASQRFVSLQQIPLAFRGSSPQAPPAARLTVEPNGHSVAVSGWHESVAVFLSAELRPSTPREAATPTASDVILYPDPVVVYFGRGMEHELRAAQSGVDGASGSFFVNMADQRTAQPYLQGSQVVDCVFVDRPAPPSFASPLSAAPQPGDVATEKRSAFPPLAIAAVVQNLETHEYVIHYRTLQGSFDGRRDAMPEEAIAVTLDVGAAIVTNSLEGAEAASAQLPNLQPPFALAAIPGYPEACIVLGTGGAIVIDWRAARLVQRRSFCEAVREALREQQRKAVALVTDARAAIASPRGLPSKDGDIEVAESLDGTGDAEKMEVGPPVATELLSSSIADEDVIMQQAYERSPRPERSDGAGDGQDNNASDTIEQAYNDFLMEIMVGSGSEVLEAPRLLYAPTLAPFPAASEEERLDEEQEGRLPGPPAVAGEDGGDEPLAYFSLRSSESDEPQEPTLLQLGAPSRRRDALFPSGETPGPPMNTGAGGGGMDYHRDHHQPWIASSAMEEDEGELGGSERSAGEVGALGIDDYDDCGWCVEMEIYRSGKRRPERIWVPDADEDDGQKGAGEDGIFRSLWRRTQTRAVSLASLAPSVAAASWTCPPKQVGDKASSAPADSEDVGIASCVSSWCWLRVPAYAYTSAADSANALATNASAPRPSVSALTEVLPAADSPSTFASTARAPASSAIAPLSEEHKNGDNEDGTETGGAPSSSAKEGTVADEALLVNLVDGRSVLIRLVTSRPGDSNFLLPGVWTSSPPSAPKEKTHQEGAEAPEQARSTADDDDDDDGDGDGDDDGRMAAAERDTIPDPTHDALCSSTIHRINSSEPLPESVVECEALRVVSSLLAEATGPRPSESMSSASWLVDSEPSTPKAATEAPPGATTTAALLRGQDRDEVVDFQHGGSSRSPKMRPSRMSLGGEGVWLVSSALPKLFSQSLLKTDSVTPPMTTRRSRVVVALRVETCPLLGLPWQANAERKAADVGGTRGGTSTSACGSAALSVASNFRRSRSAVDLDDSLSPMPPLIRASSSPSAADGCGSRTDVVGRVGPVGRVPFLMASFAQGVAGFSYERGCSLPDSCSGNDVRDPAFVAVTAATGAPLTDCVAVDRASGMGPRQLFVSALLSDPRTGAPSHRVLRLLHSAPPMGFLGRHTPQSTGDIPSDLWSVPNDAAAAHAHASYYSPSGASSASSSNVSMLLSYTNGSRAMSLNPDGSAIVDVSDRVLGQSAQDERTVHVGVCVAGAAGSLLAQVTTSGVRLLRLPAAAEAAATGGSVGGLSPPASAVKMRRPDEEADALDRGEAYDKKKGGWGGRTPSSICEAPSVAADEGASRVGKGVMEGPSAAAVATVGTVAASSSAKTPSLDSELPKCFAVTLDVSDVSDTTSDASDSSSDVSSGSSINDNTDGGSSGYVAKAEDQGARTNCDGPRLETDYEQGARAGGASGGVETSTVRSKRSSGQAHVSNNVGSNPCASSTDRLGTPVSQRSPPEANNSGAAGVGGEWSCAAGDRVLMGCVTTGAVALLLPGRRVQILKPVLSDPAHEAPGARGNDVEPVCAERRGHHVAVGNEGSRKRPRRHSGGVWQLRPAAQMALDFDTVCMQLMPLAAAGRSLKALVASLSGYYDAGGDAVIKRSSSSFSSLLNANSPSSSRRGGIGGGSSLHNSFLFIVGSCYPSRFRLFLLSPPPRASRGATEPMDMDDDPPPPQAWTVIRSTSMRAAEDAFVIRELLSTAFPIYPPFPAALLTARKEDVPCSPVVGVAEVSIVDLHTVNPSCGHGASQQMDNVSDPAPDITTSRNKRETSSLLQPPCEPSWPTAVHFVPSVCGDDGLSGGRGKHRMGKTKRSHSQDRNEEAMSHPNHDDEGYDDDDDISYNVATRFPLQWIASFQCGTIALYGCRTITTDLKPKEGGSTPIVSDDAVMKDVVDVDANGSFRTSASAPDQTQRQKAAASCELLWVARLGNSFVKLRAIPGSPRSFLAFGRRSWVVEADPWNGRLRWVALDIPRVSSLACLSILRSSPEGPSSLGVDRRKNSIGKGRPHDGVKWEKGSDSPPRKADVGSSFFRKADWGSRATMILAAVYADGSWGLLSVNAKALESVPKIAAAAFRPVVAPAQRQATTAITPVAMAADQPPPPEVAQPEGVLPTVGFVGSTPDRPTLAPDVIAGANALVSSPERSLPVCPSPPALEEEEAVPSSALEKSVSLSPLEKDFLFGQRQHQQPPPPSSGMRRKTVANSSYDPFIRRVESLDLAPAPSMFAPFQPSLTVVHPETSSLIAITRGKRKVDSGRLSKGEDGRDRKERVRNGIDDERSVGNGDHVVVPPRPTADQSAAPGRDSNRSCSFPPPSSSSSVSYPHPSPSSSSFSSSRGMDVTIVSGCSEWASSASAVVSPSPSPSPYAEPRTRSWPLDPNELAMFVTLWDTHGEVRIPCKATSEALKKKIPNTRWAKSAEGRPHVASLDVASIHSTLNAPINFNDLFRFTLLGPARGLMNAMFSRVPLGLVDVEGGDLDVGEFLRPRDDGFSMPFPPPVGGPTDPRSFLFASVDFRAPPSEMPLRSASAPAAEGPATMPGATDSSARGGGPEAAVSAMGRFEGGGSEASGFGSGGAETGESRSGRCGTSGPGAASINNDRSCTSSSSKSRGGEEGPNPNGGAATSLARCASCSQLDCPRPTTVGALVLVGSALKNEKQKHEEEPTEDMGGRLTLLAVCSRCPAVVAEEGKSTGDVSGHLSSSSLSSSPPPCMQVPAAASRSRPRSSAARLYLSPVAMLRLPSPVSAACGLSDRLVAVAQRRSLQIFEISKSNDVFYHVSSMTTRNRVISMRALPERGLLAAADGVRAVYLCRYSAPKPGQGGQVLPKDFFSEVLCNTVPRSLTIASFLYISLPPASSTVPARPGVNIVGATSTRESSSATQAPPQGTAATGMTATAATESRTNVAAQNEATGGRGDGVSSSEQPMQPGVPLLCLLDAKGKWIIMTSNDALKQRSLSPVKNLVELESFEFGEGALTAVTMPPPPVVVPADATACLFQTREEGKSQSFISNATGTIESKGSADLWMDGSTAGTEAAEREEEVAIRNGDTAVCVLPCSTGALLSMRQLEPEAAEALARLEELLAEEPLCRPIGGGRRRSTRRRTGEETDDGVLEIVRSFTVDLDLLAIFLDLPMDQQSRIAERCGDSVSRVSLIYLVQQALNYLDFDGS